MATASLQGFEVKNIRFVRPAPHGDDRHDGKSWSSAKETILAAYDDIPESGGGGTIYIAHQSKIGRDIKDGIWIVGNSDSIFATLGVAYSHFDGSRDMSVDIHGNLHAELRGWRKEKKVLFKGVGGEAPIAYGQPGAAQLGSDFTNGNNRFVLDDSYPAIWLSGVSELAFEDLIINNRSVGIRIGISVQRTSEPPVTGYIRFRRVYVDVVGMAEAHLPTELPPALRPPQGTPELRREYLWTHVGPAVEAGWALWVTFDDCVFVNSSMDATRNDPSLRQLQRGYSDRHAGILVRKFKTSAAILFVSDCIFKHGNFKYYAGGGPFNFHVHNCIIESSWDELGVLRYNPPGVHLIDPELVDGMASIQNLGLGDVGEGELGQPHGAVFIDGARGTSPESIVCINTTPVTGPATVINRPAPRVWLTETKTLTGKKQIGFWQGRIAAQHDSSRRAFPPVAVRFKNLINQDPASWSHLDSNTVLSTSKPAPDGTLNAFGLSTPAAGLASQRVLDISINQLPGIPLYPNSNSANIQEGDFIIAGVWARASTANGFLPFPTSFLVAGFVDFRYRINNLDPGESVVRGYSPLKGDGEWEWIAVVGKVVGVYRQSINGQPRAVGTNLFMDLYCHGTYSHDFYAPILLYVPKDKISENEIYEMTQHLSTWPDNVEPGTVSLLRGQDFAIQSHLLSKGLNLNIPDWVHREYANTDLPDWIRNVSVQGNDISGRIKVNAGSQTELQDRGNGTLERKIATIFFSKPFGLAPKVLLTPSNSFSSNINTFVESKNSFFSIITSDVNLIQLQDVGAWNYFVIE